MLYEYSLSQQTRADTEQIMKAELCLPHLDNLVDVPLSVVSQLDADQHQTEPRLVELLVAGSQVVGEVLGL